MNDEQPRPDDALQALARALLAHTTGPPRPLGALLTEHPAAAAQLTDALLDADATTSAVPTTPTADERRIGPYRIERELGRGGQAIVYSAIDTRLGRQVALKVLPADAFATQARLQRFRAEAATTSRLEHPGICPIHEIGEADGMHFLAMRLLEGRTLAAWLQAAAARGPTSSFALELHSSTAGPPDRSRHLGPLVAIVRLFESIASALHAAHGAGVIHRDVKPGNLMVMPDGSGVVLDFGLASDAERDGPTLTGTGDVLGTPAYMAPEQCRGEITDARTDVFALGASLFEALTGQRAFPGSTREAIVRAILSGRVPNPCRLVPAVPRELGIIAMTAMDPDPARRYQTAAAFADDLRALRELRPIHAVPPSLGLRTRRWMQRNPWLVAMTLVVALAGASVITTWRTAATKGRDNELLLMQQELQQLVTAHAGLQPAAAHVAAARQWRKNAQELVARRDEVAFARAQVRRRGRPADPGTEIADAAPIAAEIRRLQEVDLALRDGLGTQEALAEVKTTAPERARKLEQLQQQLEARRAWSFDDAADRLLHESCTTLLDAIDRFAGPEGLLPAMARELDSLASSTVGWDQAIDDIRRSPIYGGLTLRPQHELVPLRKQPGSGLWEFAHLRSGPPPRVAADGSLEFADDSGIVLVLLPGGPCRTGAQSADPQAPRYLPSLRGTERYLIDVRLDPFFLAVHEVTRAQWRSLAGTDPSFIPVGVWGVTARHPVTDVSWQVATEVLRRSTLTLPTEAQWEYAARGSEHVTDERHIDPRLLMLPENLFDAAATAKKVTSFNAALPGNDGFAYTAPVGSFAPNGFGLCDMRGNVQEWCRDPAAYPDRCLLRNGDGMWLAEPTEKHPVRGAGYLNDLSLSPLSAKALMVGGEKDRGIRAARALDDR